ncbi:hypothetical protein ABEB36_004878 [Hypothenemus hampei]|uniref:Uncharacterized protein n=1 Tax=Hypothenemus hampei TaxID=57062 RepID=A0ABD1EYN5_HYPHA
MLRLALILTLFCVCYVYSISDVVYPNKRLQIIRPTFRPDIHRPYINRPVYDPNNPPKFIRVRRYVDRNNRFDGSQLPQNQKQGGWEVKPDLSRDQRGNTRGQVTVQKHGPNHDVEAGWGQNIRGPDKHSETWHVGGSVRW